MKMFVFLFTSDTLLVCYVYCKFLKCVGLIMQPHFSARPSPPPYPNSSS